MGEVRRPTNRMFDLEVLRAPALRANVAERIWLEKMNSGGISAAMQFSREKPKIEKAVNQILDDVVDYLENT